MHECCYYVFLPHGGGASSVASYLNVDITVNLDLQTPLQGPDVRAKLACNQPLVPRKLLAHLTRQDWRCALVMSGRYSKGLKNYFLIFAKTRSNFWCPLKALEGTWEMV